MKRNAYKILSEQYSKIIEESDKEDIMAGLGEIENSFKYTPGEPIVEFMFSIDYDTEPGHHVMDQEEALSGKVVKAPDNLVSIGIPYFYEYSNFSFTGFIFCNHPAVLKFILKLDTNQDPDEETVDAFWEVVGGFFEDYFNQH